VSEFELLNKEIDKIILANLCINLQQHQLVKKSNRVLNESNEKLSELLLLNVEQMNKTYILDKIKTMQALNQSSDLIKELYNVLEEGYFQPKEIGKRSKDILIKIENDDKLKHVSDYIPILWKLIVIHQTKQLSYA